MRSEAIPTASQEVIDSGWLIGPAGALLLASQYRLEWAWQADKKGLGSFEYEINDVWIPNDDIRETESLLAAKSFLRSASFATSMLRKANGLPGSEHLACTISVPMTQEFAASGTTVKFFTRRGHYPDWLSNLDVFHTEGIAVIEISEINNPSIIDFK
ncbi:hypothetical protein [Sinosporangium album]|uniref:hypothetical protein n=1 Tax=Sinosporangium album TaxID=504805 RepID=UPI00115F7B35|nr:hypothetical protein [Sinosporangium album]